MASEPSADSFLDLLRQSGLVPDDLMLALREEYSGDRVKPDGSRELADELVKREILTRWQADMLLRGKHRGFRLGTHRILKPLGQGGMSKVFLAEHEMLRRRCAIKVLPSKYQADPDFLARFHIEARAIAALDHPHIVRAYDFNKDVRYGKEIHYLVMEYVEGPDLRRLVEEQGPLDCRKAADFICQAAEGLAHAHQAGFVHRDIKPANLLVDQSGVLKILDLGLARVTFEGEQPWETSEGEPSAVGTADYVAPEQVVDSRNVDGRADIYSLGHTFYFLLTGRRPFPKATLVELLRAHQKEQPEPIAKFRPDVPLELTEIIERMTAKEPIRRFQTAREVAEKLQTWLNESAGGGDYSRISALMAAAMRSKQPSEPDAAKTGSKESEASVLELAELDDEPKPSPSARLKAAESNKTETPKPPAAKEPPSSPKRSPQSDSRPSMSNIRADVLAELFPNDLNSAASSSDPLMMLPADEGRMQYAAPRIKQNVGLLAILKSPWFWTGLVWLVFAVLLLIWLLRPSSTDRPRERRPVVSADRKDSDRSRDGLPSDAPLSQKSDQERTGSEPASSPGKKPLAEAPNPPSAAVETPKSPEEPAAKPPTWEESAPKDAPPQDTTPEEAAPLPPAEEPVPTEPKPDDQSAQKPAKPPAAKPLDANKLLADLSEITLHFRSSDRDPKSTLNLTVKRQALDALEQLKIKIVDNDPAVMVIDIKISGPSDTFTVVISARIGIPIPGKKGEFAAIWKQNRQVVSLPSARLRQDQAMRVLRLGTQEFFESFIEDVRKARTSAKFK